MGYGHKMATRSESKWIKSLIRRRKAPTLDIIHHRFAALKTGDAPEYPTDFEERVVVACCAERILAIPGMDDTQLQSSPPCDRGDLQIADDRQRNGLTLVKSMKPEIGCRKHQAK